MENITCQNCEALIIGSGSFCQNCGNQVKCKSCSALVAKGANNCNNCGTSLQKGSSTSQPAQNTIEFNENREGRSYKVAFTDSVGGNVVEMVKNMLENKVSTFNNAFVKALNSPNEGHIESTQNDNNNRKSEFIENHQ